MLSGYSLKIERMKEKILALLKTKFQGVDDAVLDRIASKKAETVTDESQIPTLVEGISFQDVLTSYGDFRAGDASHKAVQTYEKKHNLKDGKTITKGLEDGNDPTDPKNNQDPSDFAKALQEALRTGLKPIQDELASLKGERRNQSHAELLTARFKKANIDEDFYAAAMEGRTFESDEAMETFAASIESRWEPYRQKLANDGLDRLSRPSGGDKGASQAQSIADEIAKGTKQINENKN